MSRFLLDTDTLSLLQQGNATVLQRVNSHPIADIAISVISIQEQMQGSLIAISRARTRQQLALAYDRLMSRYLPLWFRFTVLSFPKSVILRFEHLRSLRLNVGSMDLRIAAVALENGLTVVTRNRRDFGRVPGLASDDWSV
jgi:tRNA(fMet)-specific endonuclease VapC